ncbi:inter-alpha-trypsin inhibitor heavy chain H4-like isoform X2 [Photinus pyralis]|uniref:inter-alpha-trypsin inhibitor heavy chain H4-like isoform X2 n=1 Tax=Photinus pyralis TaxID=7054 RepID=UPI001267290B|nr:inter-alpha-trypsin inhibitor heavy chain H4-like isoform X2 [Photinus pyralis]
MRMGFEFLKIAFTFGFVLTVPVASFLADRDQSLIVSNTLTPAAKESEKEKPFENAPSVPQIYQLHVKSMIRNRFTHTTVTSRVRNFAEKAQEAVFSIVLPKSGFISGFIMEIGGKNYTGYVKEKEEAKRDYDQAVTIGLGAAHVAASARDSNRFTVSVNIEAEAKAAFYLTYEELLKRQDGHYEQVINIHPGQPVKDLSVEVLISESRKIVSLRALPFRSGNEIGTYEPALDPRADIIVFNDTTAIVAFSPNLERQKQLAHFLGTKEENGIAGQCVVQYDVERDPSGGEVLVQDGYFVHFFAPTDLKPLPKQVVFVLDTSGSMWGEKIEQLKQAMLNILDQLNEHDTLNLVEFNSNTKVWNIHDQGQSVWYPHKNTFYYYNQGSDNQQPVVTLENATFPRAYPANADNIKKAKGAITALKSEGSTAMFGALQVALRLVELERTQPSEREPIKRQPIVIFLTDGQPTDLTTDEIITKITEFNSEAKKSAIFALSFGDGADKEFLKKLAIRNSGFSRHIYEAADASLQLQNFYRQISSPLLSNVTFKYESTTTNLTETNFPIHFGGSEIVVAGFCGTGMPFSTVESIGIDGPISLKPVVTTTVSNMERLWAYMSINQLLKKKDASDADREALKKRALDLALKYNFVTPVSSLVVVKPNCTSAVDTEEAKGGAGLTFSGLPAGSGDLFLHSQVFQLLLCLLLLYMH